MEETSDIYKNLSHIYLQRGDPQQALKSAQAALALRPRWSHAHLTLAQVLDVLGDFEAALQSYHRAIDLEPQVGQRPEVENAIALLERKVALEACKCILGPIPSSNISSNIGSDSNAIFDAAVSPYAVTIGRVTSYLISTASKDGLIRLWCSATGCLLQTLSGHRAAVTTLTWSNCGTFFASGSLDCTARLWKLTTKYAALNNATPGNRMQTSSEECQREELFKPFGAVLTGHSKRISSIAFSPDCQLIITASPDQTVRVWEVGNEEESVCVYVLTGHSALVSSIAVSPCGSRLALASGDARCSVWDLSSGQQYLDISCDSGPVVLCDFLPWNLYLPSTNPPRSTQQKNHKNSYVSKLGRDIEGIEHSVQQSSSVLLTAHAQLARNEGRILLWDIFEKKTGWVDGHLVAPCMSIDGLRGRVTSISSCIDEQHCQLLAAACSDGSVTVWDFSSSPTAAAAKAKPVVLFSFDLVKPYVRGYTNSTLGESSFEVPAWKVESLFQSSNCHNVVSFSSDGALLAASGGGSYDIQVYKVDSGDRMCHLPGHTSTIRALKWIPRIKEENGDYKGKEEEQEQLTLMSACEDGTTRIWNVKSDT